VWPLLCAMDAASLREVGIVHLSQAIQDNALGVDNKTGPCDRQSQFWWCTLCSQCLARASAYRHRDKHRKQWEKGNRGDFTTHLYPVLDELYGVCVTIMYTS
jgi:hypothetical protein